MGKSHWPGATLAPVVLLTLFGFSSGEAAVGQRCDVVAQDRCMDLSKLNGAVIRVPLATTRIASEGLNLCGTAGSNGSPTDIVYVVDQTTSMVPEFILPRGEDTTGWRACGNIKASGTTVFHGVTVNLPPEGTTYPQMAAVCEPAGDPYSARVTTVQNAIRFQATKSPNSYASFISFAANINAAQMTMTPLSTNASVEGLVSQLTLSRTNSTNYRDPLTWARIQLYGGASGKKVVAPSANSSKAVIFISDGAPNTPNPPGYESWKQGIRPTSTVTWNKSDWTTSSTEIPPVFTIFLGDSIGGGALKELADSTHGAFFQIPPSMPDSLARVIQRILGQFIQPATPDSLVLTNLTNGQSSRSVSKTSSGGSFRLGLDSLVALEIGANTIKSTIKQGATSVSATWTILVADTTTTFPKGALDSVLTTRCGPASALTIKPDQSGLAWADTADRNLLLNLQTTPERNALLQLQLVTRKSKDAETIGITVPATNAPEKRAAFPASIAWQNLVWEQPVPGDLVIRSGFGWDSARVSFQMPRDRRDTASAVIGLHHPTIPELRMTESVDGPSGRIDVSVIDSEITATSVVVTIHHRLGDSLRVRLNKGGDGAFHGSFGFAQGVGISTRDTALQLGTAYALLDSVWGNYFAQKATTQIHMPTARLRFVDALGEPRDTVSVAMALGGKFRITIQAFLGDELCTTCGSWVRLTPSDAGISVYSIQGAGTPIDSLRLVRGQLVVELRGQAPVRNGNLAFWDDSLGSELVAKPIRISPTAPDSVVYRDEDGDGSLDRADVFLGMAWRDGNGLRLPWADSTQILDFLAADRSLSDDTTVLSLAFRGVAPLVTAAKGPLVGRWRYDESWDWMPVKVIERIAPVPLRAVLRRGAIFDTLRVSASERIWPTLNPINRLLAKLQVDGQFAAISPRQARLDGTTGELVLVFPADSTDLMVMPGDSIRFARGGSVRDSLGNVPGEFARKVIVEGIDRAPLSSFIYDVDADGRADRVVLRLRSPLGVTDRVGFRWPDASGNLETRELPIEAAAVDSSGRMLTFDLDPFAYGSTSCPRAGCQNLAWFSTSRFKDAGVVEFGLRDKVDPIILEAKFVFSAPGDTPDSLLLHFSEPLKAGPVGSWIAWGRPSADSLGQAIRSLAIPKLLGGDRAVLLLDSTFPAHPGDSVRLFAKSTGALADTAGNAAESFAHWSDLVFSQPAIVIATDVPRPMLIDRGWDPPAGPPVTILVRKNEAQPWTTLTGDGPSQPIERYSGVTLSLNRIPEGGGLYVYDLMGTAVVQFSLTDLQAAVAAGNLERTRRGDYQIFLAWDGRDMKGQKVSTGVYLARIYGWVRENNVRTMVNVLKKMGIRRELPINKRLYK